MASSAVTLSVGKNAGFLAPEGLQLALQTIYQTRSDCAS